MRTLIKEGVIVNEGEIFKGNILLEDDRIAEISNDNTYTSCGICDETIDATGCFVLPGVIDEHVHFREPGMEDKADIASESRAVAFGGVTSFFDMPNTKPQTTTPEQLKDKFQRAAKSSSVNYSFFFGATNDNTHLLKQLDFHLIPGVKLFMGASTGNMLVDNEASLETIFRVCAELSIPLMVHCEDSNIIARNLKNVQARYGEDPSVVYHPVIRSEEACYESSALAVRLAHKYGTRLHIAHISTAKELDLLDVRHGITGEACLAHLYFSDKDYPTLGALIKCNPAVKNEQDRTALRKALCDGRIFTIGTDHAPHLLSQKQGGCVKAASGMPFAQFSLVTMLELVDQGILPIEQLVTLMSHHPAELFRVSQRGFLRPGYKADIVIVRPHAPWILEKKDIQSKCGWSPMLGHQFQWRVEHTICNGHHIYNKGVFDEDNRGEAIAFRS